MTKNTVKVEGMMCGMCEAHICDAIRRAFPAAKKVSASHAKGEAVFMTPEEADPAAVKKAIEDTGYGFVSVNAAPVEKKGLFGKLRGGENS